MGAEGLRGRGRGPDLHRRATADDLDVGRHQLVEVTLGVALGGENNRRSANRQTHPEPRPHLLLEGNRHAVEHALFY